MLKIDKDIRRNKVDVNKKNNTLEVAMLKIDKDINVAMKEIAKEISENKVEVNNKIESLLSRMNLNKLESN